MVKSEMSRYFVSVLVWLDHINIVQYGHLFLVSPHTGLHGESRLPPNLHILGGCPTPGVFLH
jgi:hypothetical protein